MHPHNPTAACPDALLHLVRMFMFPFCFSLLAGTRAGGGFLALAGLAEVTYMSAQQANTGELFKSGVLTPPHVSNMQCFVEGGGGLD